MLSSLSMVPPEKLSPRPLILPTGSPHAAAIGPTASVVLSPTPPDECLSTITTARQRVVQVELVARRAIASVRSVVSWSVMPRK
jgi:hypothetical protein